MSSGSTPARAGPRIVLIVATARNRVIGKNGKMPWHLSADLKRFKTLTMGHPIIMGRKTFESIGRTLPGRRNIVISRDAELSIEGAETATSFQSAISLCANADEVFVIGGQQIYLAALPFADRIELTEVDLDVDGDVWFPEIDHHYWHESGRESHREETSGMDYCFVTLHRAGKPGLVNT